LIQILAEVEKDVPRLHLKVFSPKAGHSVCTGRHRFNTFNKEGYMLRMEQNESLKGNVKWEYKVQRGACSGITCY